MAKERLQKVIARTGLTSRRQADQMIERGEVTVNGRVARPGERVDRERDAIKVRGRALPREVAQVYLLLNKPAGFVTTRRDEAGRRTVFELVPPRWRRGLHAVGRLDYQTEGLLLLTTDGEFSNRVAHPRFGCHKTYEVKVKGRPAPESVARLLEGLVIDGRRTRAVSVHPRAVRGPRGSRKNSWWTVELDEGRTRQIREMFFRIGHPVQKLRRVAIGRLRDAGLPPGGVRELTEQEVGMLSGPAAGTASRGR